MGAMVSAWYSRLLDGPAIEIGFDVSGWRHVFFLGGEFIDIALPW